MAEQQAFEGTPVPAICSMCHVNFFVDSARFSPDTALPVRSTICDDCVKTVNAQQVRFAIQGEQYQLTQGDSDIFLEIMVGDDEWKQIAYLAVRPTCGEPITQYLVDLINRADRNQVHEFLRLMAADFPGN